ncbi:putative HAAAP family transport protein [Vibrio mimicus VM603]|uniref:Putative HAAAP family transport protein n=2 Tax=Vibrio mimicus TaxID=674 RepID=D2YAI0_VIBMI|nr:putative HAAAP family transport protein [Vibrio mimicus VM603]
MRIFYSNIFEFVIQQTEEYLKMNGNTDESSIQGLSPSDAKPAPWDKAGMTKDQWKIATKFDSTDIGWVIMSIGMAIGAGIVFLPVKVGVLGLWVFLASAVIGYPAMYLFQKLFINTLSESPKCLDYAGVISGYLGNRWGTFLGILYFIMIVIWMFVYSTAMNNDSASFLHSFGLTEGLLSENPFYGLALVVALVSVASRGEQLLFKVSSGLVMIKLGTVALLGVMMVSRWDTANISDMPAMGNAWKDVIELLPFTLTSILFIQSLSPMVISYRSREKSIEVARYKAMRAMNIAFGILFVTVFFYAISFTLAMSHEQALIAQKENISALAMVAGDMDGTTLKLLSLTLNIFAVITAFFGVYLGFRDSCQGLVMLGLKRVMPEEKINIQAVSKGISLAAITLAWGAIVLNLPVLSFTSVCSPIFGLLGCLIPAYLVYRVPALHKYKGLSLYLIIGTGILLCISPFIAFS